MSAPADPLRALLEAVRAHRESGGLLDDDALSVIDAGRAWVDAGCPGLAPQRHRRHQYSIVDVCVRLAGHLSGAGDTLSCAEEQELSEWLTWRISAGWAEPTLSYDHAVRGLARAVLADLKPVAE